MTTIHAGLTAEKFLETAGPWLEKEEVNNNSLLGIAASIAAKPPGERQEHHFWTVQEGKSLTGAAFWTPPFKLTLSDMDPGAAAALGKKLKGSHPLVPGVLGPQAILPAFLRSWCGPGVQAELDMSTRLYRLDKVQALPAANGAMRPAEEKDLGVLSHWFGQFREEIGAAEPLEALEWVRMYIRERRLFVWEAGQPCAMAGFSGSTAHGARLNMVYTPRSLRKRGYASNLTASLCSRLLGSGKEFCVLYADLLNPTSNHIYQRVGFTAVGDWDGYIFKDFEGLEE